MMTSTIREWRSGTPFDKTIALELCHDPTDSFAADDRFLSEF